MLGKIALSALLVTTFTIGFAQRSSLMIRNRHVTTVKGLFTAKFVGKRSHDGKEQSQIIVTLSRADLPEFETTDPASPDSWWLWKGSQNRDGVVHPYPDALPDHPTSVSAPKVGNDFVLNVDANQLGLHEGDGLLVMWAGKRRSIRIDDPVVLNEQGLNLHVNRPAPVETFAIGGISVAPHEQLEDGSSKFVVHATLNYDKPDVNAGLIGARLHFVSINVLSTAKTDKSAYFSAILLAEKVRKLDDVFVTVPLSPFVKLDSSESFNNQSWSVGIVSKVRVRGTRFGMGESVNASRDASLYLVPLQFQDRYRREGPIPDWDTRSNVLVSSATLMWEPIFLWTAKDVPDIDKDYSLHFGGNLWYFPDRSSAPGIGAKRTESRADVELQIPFSKIGLQKRIPFPVRLSVAFGTGAVPSSGYLRTTTINFGVKAAF